MDFVEHDIQSGSSLSEALAHHHDQLFNPELVAMVKVAEESGQLSSMLVKITDEYQERIRHSLTLFTTIFQPLLMLILGLFVTLLIFAVYVPIINLSAIIH